ncbi:hypothetical protein KIN20_005327 [Parelaphostrongylus tenuis]|uniref:Uncharacterized protein n=1 Tax=Parelaphostrongylus tenuis TaxID=148309 RepID=A0AAD5QFT5_PARTN|nr:hypothetical protein KIN20_005327 [Parelaphostrongylus tenuis]
MIRGLRYCVRRHHRFMRQTTAMNDDRGGKRQMQNFMFLLVGDLTFFSNFEEDIGTTKFIV